MKVWQKFERVNKAVMTSSKAQPPHKMFMEVTSQTRLLKDLDVASLGASWRKMFIQISLVNRLGFRQNYSAKIVYKSAATEGRFLPEVCRKYEIQIHDKNVHTIHSK